MQIGKIILISVLLACACFSRFAQSQSLPKGDAGRCNDAVVNSVGKYFHLHDFSYPRESMYPSAENGGRTDEQNRWSILS